MGPFLDRMVRAAKLDVDLYEEVEADSGATGQAMQVVALSSFCAGIGTASEGIAGLTAGVLAALVGWFLWAFVTYWIGTRLLPGPNTEADLGQLLRTTGFSSSPGVFRALGIIPGIGGFAIFVVSVWMLIAMVIAVRQALDYEGTGRAVAVCVIGWALQIACFVAVLMLLGGLGLMPEGMTPVDQ
jgi:hypothetical protein